MFESLGGHILSVDAKVIRACGCVEDHGRVSFRSPSERETRAHLIHRLVAWHAHGSDLAQVVAHASALPTDALHDFLKADVALRFLPKTLKSCAGADCFSPFRGIAVPRHLHFGPVAGAGPVFPYTGKLITTNKIHGVAQNEPVNVGMGLGGGTHQNYDAALFNPSAEARVAGTASLVSTATGFSTAPAITDTEQVIGTITASGTRAVTEAGLFDASTAAPATTLAAAISSNSATSITLTAALNGTVPYDLEVSDNGTHTQETMIVTAGAATTTPTVTRGARGSTAQAAINNGGYVTGGSGTTGGNAYVLADFAVINLSNGDSLQLTFKLQYT